MSNFNFMVAFNRLTEAYIKNQVNPFNSCNCFVGNLLNNDRDWDTTRTWKGVDKKGLTSTVCKKSYFVDPFFCKVVVAEHANGFYTPEDILELERIFLSTYLSNGGKHAAFDIYIFNGEIINGPTQKDEDALFVAFEKTLDLLKQIHINKGENVDSYNFVKRENKLQTV